MKKFLALILALLMMMSMATTAMAETVTAAGEASTATVKGTCVEGTSEAPITYSVDIVWGDLSFTYNEANVATWDPVNHKYNDDAREAGWVDKTVTATITNHSNTAIMASFSYEANSGYESAGMQFGADGVYVASAATNNRAESASNTVKPTGSLPKGTENADIGTITITIAKAEDVTKEYAKSSVMAFATMMVQYNNIAVESADNVVSGRTYVLKAEADALDNLFNEQQDIINASETTDAEAAAAYYTIKTAFESFANTKVYTKP